MDCTHIEEKLARDFRDADVESHLERCVTCRVLADGDLASSLALMARPVGPPDPLFVALSEDLLASIARPNRLARLRSVSTQKRVALGLFVAILLTAGVLFALPRADLSVYPSARMALALATLALTGVLCVVGALRPLHLPPLGRPLFTGLVIAAALLPFALAFMPPAHLEHSSSLGGLGPDLVSAAAKCFAFGLVLALPLLAVLRLLDRIGHRSLRRALMAAGAAGLLGNLILQLHCPIVHPVHLVTGHASVAVAFVVLYGLLWQHASRNPHA